MGVGGRESLGVSGVWSRGGRMRIGICFVVLEIGGWE